MNKVILFLSILFIGCLNSPKIKVESFDESDNTNYLDLFYLNMLESQPLMTVSNIDSLGFFQDVEEPFNQMLKNKLIDSSKIQSIISSGKKLEEKVNDSIKIKLKGNEKANQFVTHNFSKIFTINEFKRCIFWNSHYDLKGYRLSSSEGVIIYTKDVDGWELESFNILNNYTIRSKI